MENVFLNRYKEKRDAIVQIIVTNNENNEWAILEVLCNGPGIMVDFLTDIIFEPFKTTKESGSGMAISSIGGNISAENRTDTEATFIIELPK